MRNKDLICNMITYMSELYIALIDILYRSYDSVEEFKEAVNRDIITMIKHRKRLLNAMLSGYYLSEEDEKNGEE